MNMYKATINVTLKKSVLDPQGQTVLHALDSLGFKEAKNLRVGKFFELTLDAENRQKAEGRVRDPVGTRVHEGFPDRHAVGHDRPRDGIRPAPRDQHCRHGRPGDGPKFVSHAHQTKRGPATVACGRLRDGQGVITGAIIGSWQRAV